MTREEKIQKRIQRSLARRSKRMKWYVTKIRSVNQYGSNVPLNSHDKHGERNFCDWVDKDSPTGYTQICSYDVWGTCPSPCDGSC